MKITIGEATIEQIEQAIRNNPDRWIDLDGDQQVSDEMDDIIWREQFEESLKYFDGWGDPERADWTEDEDGDKEVDWDGETTKRQFENYIRCSKDCFEADNGGWVTIDDLDIDIRRCDNILHIVFLLDGKKYDEYWSSSGCDASKWTIEVDD